MHGMAVSRKSIALSKEIINLVDEARRAILTILKEKRWRPDTASESILDIDAVKRIPAAGHHLAFSILAEEVVSLAC